MKTLHIDTGREMHGGQWQTLYLTDRLADSVLLARGALLDRANAKPLSWLNTARMARDFDLIHAHDARAHTMAAICGGPPLVVSRGVAFAIGSRWKYSRAALFLAVSQFVAAQLMNGGVPADRIRVVHDGVPLPDAMTTREPNRVVALASKPIQLPNIPIHLTTNLIHDLATASIFVYRSEMEGLGSAALAAQAAGVPVIASNVGGLPEAVEHERTGLLVDNDNFEPAIQRLLQNPKEAEEMGMRGRERVERHFTIDIMVEKTKQAYQEVLR